MAQAHPEMASLADLHREHAEQFLGWLGTQTNQQTGAPLSISFRRTVVTLITRFVTETAAWGWDDVPARVLFTRGDIPKIPKPLPRFIPDHELAKLMIAVDQLPNRYQRAALIVARWSGARRDEIYRGTCSRRSRQGISPGWSDVYESYLDGQSLPLPTDLPAGTYCLTVTVDPEDRVLESNEDGNTTSVELRLALKTAQMTALRRCTG